MSRGDRENNNNEEEKGGKKRKQGDDTVEETEEYEDEVPLSKRGRPQRGAKGKGMNKI